MLGLLWACARAVGSFLVRRPRVVVVVGGYAGFPAGLAAVVTRVPLVSVTTDAVPGAVNGFLGRFAAANAVAFDGTGLPRAHVTGTPVRPEVSALDAWPAGVRRPAGLPWVSRTVDRPWPPWAARSAPAASTGRWASWPAAGRTGTTGPCTR